MAYFTMDKAVKGSKRYAFQWRGASWHFSMPEHRERFAEEPEKYAPQYGGYDAYAVAESDTAKTDPTEFTLSDGKLCLNYNHKISKMAGRQGWLYQGSR